MRLNDGTTKIFLNALGTKGDVSPELKAFLGYVAGNKSDDEFVKELDGGGYKNKGKQRMEARIYDIVDERSRKC